jgi:hypothetical protein
VHFGGGRQKEIRGGRPPEVAAGRIRGVSRLMALAIRLDQLLREHEVGSYSEIACLGQVMRAGDHDSVPPGVGEVAGGAS